MNTLAPPDPATRKDIVRDRPYGSIIARRFDPELSSVAERNLYRWLYRRFREVENGSPFSARARIVTATFMLDEVTADLFDLITDRKVS